MNGPHYGHWFPGPRFRRLPPAERRGLASDLLNLATGLLHRLRAAGPASQDVRDLIAWAAACQDLEEAAAAWRTELRLCWGRR